MTTTQKLTSEQVQIIRMFAKLSSVILVFAKKDCIDYNFFQISLQFNFTVGISIQLLVLLTMTASLCAFMSLDEAQSKILI